MLLKEKYEGRRGRRRKQLLDDLKEKSRCLTFKEKVLAGTLWKIRFGTCDGPSQGRLRNVCVCVCVCVYTHTYIHTYIHTYEYTRSLLLPYTATA